MNRAKYSAARLVARSLGALQLRDEPARSTRMLMYHDLNEAGARDRTTASGSSRGTFTDAAQSMRIPRIDIWSHDAGSATIEKTRGDWDRLLP